MFSSHGTFVNDEKLTAGHPMLLQERDVIKFGGSTRKYKLKLGPGPTVSIEKKEKEPREREKEPREREKDRDKAKEREREKDTDKDKEKPRSKEKVSKDKDRSKDAHKHKEREKEKGKHKRKRSRDGESDRDSHRKHKAQSKEEMIRCRHILIKHADSRRPSSWKESKVTRTLDEAMTLINDLRHRIVSGRQTFEQIANTESHCGSYQVGGDLGHFGRGKMQKAFEEAAFNLRVSEISNPVVSDSGVHIILRTE